MNTSIAMLSMFALRLAIPFVILFGLGELCARLEKRSSQPFIFGQASFR